MAHIVSIKRSYIGPARRNENISLQLKTVEICNVHFLYYY